MPGRLVALHLPLPPSRGLVGAFSSVVQSLVLPVLDPGHDLPLRRSVARQLVGDHDARRPALPPQQLSEQALGGPLVAPALHQDVEHRAVLVHRAPEPVLHARDRHRDLIEVPLVTGPRQTAPDLIGEGLAELQAPLPHGLVAHADAASGQQLVDVAQAQREPKVKPHGMADDLGREAVAGVAGAGRRRHPTPLLGPTRSGKPPT